LVRSSKTPSERASSASATFPDGKFDDQVDALSIIGANLKLVLERARQRAERHGRWAPEEGARHSKAPVDEPARPRLKPHNSGCC
jgi:hypothetical protein